MVIEAKIRPDINPDYENISAPKNNLIAIADFLAEKKFRQRQIGKLIATTIATTNPRMDNDSYCKRDNALRELAQYFPAQRLTRFIAKIENPIARRSPIVRSLLSYL